MNKIKLSACIITYNHEEYLRECLEGAVNQIVDFDYEIIIGQDKSTDSTHSICVEYAERYPDLIKYFPREKNLGMIGNWIETIKNCTGEYIALCEGDDYWTDPLKLQKQVDFLEKNKDYGAVCSMYQILQEEVESVTFLPNTELDVTTEMLLHENPIGTLTMMVENDLVSALIKQYNFKMDIDLWLNLSVQKKIKYLPIETAVYRVLQNSASSRNDLKKQANFLRSIYLIREPFIFRSDCSSEDKFKFSIKGFKSITSTLIKGRYFKLWVKEWCQFFLENKFRKKMILIFVKEFLQIIR